MSDPKTRGVTNARVHKGTANDGLKALGNTLRTGVDLIAAAVAAIGERRLPPADPAATVAIRAALFEPESGFGTFGKLADFEDARRRETGSWLWVDVEGSPSEAHTVLAELGIERSVLQSISLPGLPAKFERFGKATLLVYRELEAQRAALSSQPLLVIVGEGIVVSSHAAPSAAVDDLRRDLNERVGAPVPAPVDLAVRLGRLAIIRLVNAVAELEDVIDDLEDRVFAEPDDAILSELTAWKSRLRLMARAGRVYERVGARIADELLADAPEARSGVVALIEQAERLRGLSEMHAHAAGDLTDGYLALSAHRLNRVMQILTVITVIFVPLTFLAGIYGMNFANMPELATRYGYFALLGVMFVAGVVQFIYFRRKKWV